MSTRYQTIEELLDANTKSQKPSRPYCDCGEVLYETANEIVEADSGITVEYEMKCSRCKKVFGVWAYGAFFDNDKKLF